jgi:hypothetical protein
MLPTNDSKCLVVSPSHHPTAKSTAHVYPPGHPGRASVVNNLGQALQIDGSVVNLEKAIELQEEGLTLSPSDGHQVEVISLRPHHFPKLLFVKAFAAIGRREGFCCIRSTSRLPHPISHIVLSRSDIKNFPLEVYRHAKNWSKKSLPQLLTWFFFRCFGLTPGQCTRWTWFPSRRMRGRELASIHRQGIRIGRYPPLSSMVRLLESVDLKLDVFNSLANISKHPNALQSVNCDNPSSNPWESQSLWVQACNIVRAQSHCRRGQVTTWATKPLRKQIPSGYYSDRHYEELWATSCSLWGELVASQSSRHHWEDTILDGPGPRALGLELECGRDVFRFTEQGALRVKLLMTPTVDAWTYTPTPRFD